MSPMDVNRESTALSAAVLGSGNNDRSHGFLMDVLRMLGTTLTYNRNEEIYGEGEPSEFVYMVVSGTVRTYKLLADGRRQIAAFCLPGDIFGLDATDLHSFTAEAVEKCRVVVTKRSTVLSLARRDGDFAGELWRTAAMNLDRANTQLLLLGRKNANEKVASFLLEMADRTHADDSLSLPMSRQDIADYLGLTIETVSRTISHLEHDETIELPRSRQIRLRNKSALARMNA